ncbi:MAG: 4-alpha-glucanotransferase [Pseudohongiellaceae bacterium]
MYKVRLRQCGVLLHPTSLPGNGRYGNLGSEAYRFIDFLAAAGIGWWQVLPLGPTGSDLSPYHSLSAFAGNPRMISLAEAVRMEGMGQLEAPDVDYDDEEAFRAGVFGLLDVFMNHSDPALQRECEIFCDENRYWLEDYALFTSLRLLHNGKPWTAWPEPIKKRDRQALEEAAHQLGDDIARVRFEQFLFFRQWSRLRKYARTRRVSLMGDMPFFVAHDSAEVWASQKSFDLDDGGSPRTVAGVPPDYFSETGQRWGNPQFNWQSLEQEKFGWWRNRIKHLLDCFDLIRIDHFRGFDAVWEIPAAEKTAVSGRWINVPGDKLLAVLKSEFDSVPFVAEDLGLITEGVLHLRDHFRLPGTKVLQFAFDSDADNPYLPHNYEHNFVVYTGTHDNDTTLGWYKGLNRKTKDRVDSYLGYPQEPVPWPLIRLAMASVASLAIFPMQDLLAQDSSERMNVPGTVESNNWRYRFDWQQMDDDLGGRLREMVTLYGRKA